MARTSVRRRGGDHSFSAIPQVSIPRSVFDRSCGVKATFDAGWLIPIFVDDVLPGDTMSLRASSLCRLSTPIFPVMDNVFMDFFFFYVPNRLVWDNWAKFCGEQTDPGDPTDFLVPIMNEAVAVGSLSDYMGLPLSATGYDHVSLWHRAYNLIFNEWFRDQNLIDSAVVDRDDGPDSPADYVLRRRGKRHDYFTSCLPFTQKGDPVTIPISGSGEEITVRASDGTGGISDITNVGGTLTATSTPGVSIEFVDPGLTQLVNDLRQSVQVQRLLERDARGGSRLTEIIRSHFGVVSPDARLQRPEYLGGGTSRVNFHAVARTTSLASPPHTSGPPNATLGAFAVQSAEGIGFNKSFTEHGVVIGLVSVRADLTYQQGLERMFSRRTRYEFYWPAFAHLGEQAVLNKEIFLQDTAADDAVFGYQERYAEYRYKPSRLCGLFRSDAAASLHQWHLGIDFAALPALNQAFIEEDPPIDRVIAVPSEPHFIGDFWFKYRCARPMPVFSVPGMVDHF